jgi:WD40 repeat protein
LGPRGFGARLLGAALLVAIVAGCSAGGRSGAAPAGSAAAGSASAGPSRGAAVTGAAAAVAVPRMMPAGALRPRAVALMGGTTDEAAWSPDGTLLATANAPLYLGAGDFTVRLWRRNGTLAGLLRGHLCAVTMLAWSPNSRTLASSSCDGTVRLWRRDGQLVRTLRPRSGAVLAVAWSPDGTQLATGSMRTPTDNKVQLWSVATGRLTRMLGTRYSTGRFYNLAWSPDGRFIVAGAIDYREWNAADGHLMFDDTGCAQCPAAQGFAWSPDSTRWATGDSNGDVSVYRTDGRLLAQVTNADGPVNALAWSPDGRFLAGANTIWRMQGAQTPVQATLVPPAPRLTPTPRLTPAPRLAPAPARRPAPVPTSRAAAASSARAAITAKALEAFRDGVVSLAWSPKSDELAITFATTPGVYVFGAQGTRLATLTGHRGTVSWVGWSPNGLTLASGSADSTVRFWGPAD